MKNILKTMALAILAAAAAATVQAAPIVSGDGTETCVAGVPIGNGPCNVVIVDEHPLWQPSGTGQWISYADTGYKGTVLAPPSGTTWVFSVFEQFTVIAPSSLTLSVWADDTAGVLLDGVMLAPLTGSAPNFVQQTCAKGSLGCEPAEAGVFTSALTAGAHTLEFQVYQVGTGPTPALNPFGLLYEGDTGAGALGVVSAGPSAAVVPLPASGLLLVGAVAGVGAAFRRGRTGKA